MPKPRRSTIAVSRSRKAHQLAQQKRLHSSADSFESLLRARLYRAMKEAQKKADEVALVMMLSVHSQRHLEHVLSTQQIEDILTAACAEVIKKCFMRGGKLGAEHLKDMVDG